MGAASSRIEDDKALQLCRDRKKFVRQALDGRCSLAAAHVTYIQSLKSTGTSLLKFVEPEAPIESSLYTSTSATPEALSLTEKSLSHFSFSSPSMSRSQHVDGNETFSPTPSPPHSTQFQANHMKFRGTPSQKVEEKPSLTITATIDTSPSPLSTDRSEARASPWDFFGLSDPGDNQFSFHESFDDMRRVREEEGIPDLEVENEEVSSFESEDEFDDEPSADTLVRSFENRNRVPESEAASESESANQEKSNSPALSPLRATTSSAAPLPIEMKKIPEKDEQVENKVAPKDFFSSMKQIEYLFVKASDSGKEVPRMLEANKLHFRAIIPGKGNGSVASTIFKAVFSCGHDPSYVHEEPAQNAIKYLTWHRTTSSRSSSSMTPFGIHSKDDMEDLTSDIFETFCMNSGSHASTLDRLYAWERKLYDEVKASQMVRKDYDMKCKLLRQQESKGTSSHRVDRTRANVKDLHSRIRVAIHRIDSISKRIEELRDKELQPQLEELIEGLSRMWDVMSECHRLQFQIISVAYNNGNTKISVQSESHRPITLHLENELSSLASCFTKWIVAQKSYVKAIDGWLSRCVTLPQKTSKRKRRVPDQPWRIRGPPIYVTCGVWLEKLDKLPTKEVSDSIKGLASETTHFLPRQDKNQAKNMIRSYSRKASAPNMSRDEASEDWISAIDRFRSSFEGFLGQLNNFADSSVNMYKDLDKAIREVKSTYEQPRNQ